MSTPSALALNSGLTLTVTDDAAAIDALRADVAHYRRCFYVALDVANAAHLLAQKHYAEKDILYEWRRVNLAMTLCLVGQLAAVLDERATFARCAERLLSE